MKRKTEKRFGAKIYKLGNWASDYKTALAELNYFSTRGIAILVPSSKGYGVYYRPSEWDEE
jgi:hypothetical protein